MINNDMINKNKINYDTEAVRNFQAQVARGTPSVTARSKDDMFSSEPRRAKKPMKSTKATSSTIATQFATDGTITVSHTATTVTQVETDAQQLAHFVAPILDALPQVASNSATKTVTTPALPTVPAQGKPIEMRVFPNRMDTIGDAQTVTLPELFTKLQTPIVTSETMDAYTSLKKDQQNNLKDKGLYLLGVTNGTGKGEADIIHRTAGAIDIDDNTDEHTKEIFLQAFQGLEILYHTTRKSRPFNPRYRIIVPFSVPVTTKDYPIIMQYLSNHLQGYGIHVDESCTRVTQGMFFPTISSDQHIHYGKHIDHVTHYGEETTKHPCGLLDVTEILNRYTTLAKTAAPMLSHEKQKSVPPRERKGLEGIFNRAYRAHEGIQTFLPHVYEFDEKSGRYLHHNSTSGEAGLIVNDDETIHSMHGACDAFGGKTGSIYQLVLRHMFAGDAHAMQEHFNTDERIRKALEQEYEEGEAWRAQLIKSESGKVTKDIRNAEIIALNWKKLECISFNEFSNRVIVDVKACPWRRDTTESLYTDSDSHGLELEIAKEFGITGGKEFVEMVFKSVVTAHKFNPVHEYLKKSHEEWEKAGRTENIQRLFIDYLGTEDNRYTRECAELMMLGAVARALHPGCKFDYVVTFLSKQGGGKSTLIERLAEIGGGQQEYFCGDITSLNGKDAEEIVVGRWIVELPEGLVIKKSEVEKVKAFISKRNAYFRPAYGRHTKQYARTCIFIATTNKFDMLNDTTGGRRFLPIVCKGNNSEGIHALTKKDMMQLFGEAYDKYIRKYNSAKAKTEEGEEVRVPLLLSKESEEIAKQKQREHTEQHPLLESYLKYLDSWAVDIITKGKLQKDWLKLADTEVTKQHENTIKHMFNYTREVLGWDTHRTGSEWKALKRPNTTKDLET